MAVMILVAASAIADFLPEWTTSGSRRRGRSGSQIRKKRDPHHIGRFATNCVAIWRIGYEIRGLRVGRVRHRRRSRASAGATAVCHRIPTRPCLLRTCRRLRQCPLCPRRRHLATFTALATFACRSGCTSAAVEAGAIVGADGAAVVTRAASSCGSFVRVTARWLPITDVRRGLTQILLSHHTVGSMTAINVKTHGATGDGTSDDYDRGEPGSRRQARGGDRPPIKGSAPLGPYCRDIPRK
jgi:hypothetical protein